MSEEATLLRRIAELEDRLVALRGGAVGEEAGLLERIADLEGRLAALGPRTAPPPVGETVFTPSPLAHVRSLTLDRVSTREAWGAVEAVALALGEPSPGPQYPSGWPVRAVVEARQQGASWAEALERAGLEPPADLTAEAAAVRRASLATWEEVGELVARAAGHLRRHGRGHLERDLIEALRPYLE